MVFFIQVTKIYSGILHVKNEKRQTKNYKPLKKEHALPSPHFSSFKIPDVIRES